MRMRFDLTELTRRSADFVMRSTLLALSTTAWKESAGLGFVKEWAAIAGRGWDELGNGHRRSFERYGIGVADWDRLRAISIAHGDGVRVLRPGDLMAQGWTNDRGNTIAGFMTGPTLASILDPTVNLALGNIGEAGGGQDANISREALRFVKGNLPGVNAWYSKLEVERLLLDELGNLVDPNVRQGRRRMVRTARDQGTSGGRRARMRRTGRPISTIF